MKHASPDSIRRLEPLLARIRGLDGLIERKLGIFYWKSSAFLHFHEDGAGLFADAKLNGVEFERMAVSTEEQREVFWTAVSACHAAQTSAGSQRLARKVRAGAA